MEQEIPEINTSSQTVVKPIEEDPKSSSPMISFSGNKLKIILPVIGILFVILVILGLAIGIPAYKVYGDARQAYKLALNLKDTAKSQDIKKTHDAVVSTKNQVVKVRSDLNALSWTKVIPFFGGYTSDAIHLANAGKEGLEAAEILTNAVEPYADILGLKGQGTFVGGTTEDRLAKMVETLDKVTPQIDIVADKMALVKKEVDFVDPNRYPESFQGKIVRGRIVELKNVIDLSGDFLTQARPLVKKLPTLLGAQSEQKYLFLFQNNAEIRPTGGFITAYAVFRVEKGKIHMDTSDDIYKLDDTITKHVTPPEPISLYLNVYGWRLRDSNFSPDFVSSMKTFEDLYNSSSDKKPIQGIIAVDTNVLIALMNVLGPIQIYGTNFTTNKVPGCDCPMVIYELEKYADEPKSYERGSRKDIIGVLLQEIMRKAMSAPKQVYSPLFQSVLTQATQKHLLVYLHDPDAQAGMEAINFAGRIKSYDGDYLHVNDANLGGAKSNLYIVPSVKQEVTVTPSGADTTLSIDYRYPHEADNCSLERKAGLCLAGIYRDYLRVYLPPGAKVSEVRGFENKSQTYSDLDHTAVAGFFTVVPEGLAKIQIKYSVTGNFKSKGIYRELIQKQPGTDQNKYTVIVNGQSYQFNLVEDKELSVKL